MAGLAQIDSAAADLNALYRIVTVIAGLIGSVEGQVTIAPTGHPLGLHTLHSSGRVSHARGRIGLSSQGQRVAGERAELPARQILRTIEWTDPSVEQDLRAQIVANTGDKALI